MNNHTSSHLAPCAATPDLTYTALSYALGVLSSHDAALFEARLEHDAAAREALAQSVELAATSSPLNSTRPDPLTKAALSERHFPTLLSRLLPRRAYRGHPALWATLGGVLVTMVFVLLGTPFQADPAVQLQSTVVQQHSLEAAQPSAQSTYQIAEQEPPSPPQLEAGRRLIPYGENDVTPISETLRPMAIESEASKHVPIKPQPVPNRGERAAAPPTTLKGHKSAG
jgi:hypothetical protein